MVRAPSPGKSRALQARLRPTMRPFPSPKLGRVPLSSEGASRKGVALRLPSPMNHPARSRVGHPLVPCMIVLFCSFFFFFFANFARVPAARHSPAAATARGLSGRRARPGAFVSAAPGVAPNSALLARQRGPRGCGGGSGAWSVPSASQTAASAPSRPRDRGPGAMRGAQAPMAGPGT